MYTAEKVQENLSNSSSNISYEHSSSLHNIHIEMSSLPSADSKTRQIYMNPEHHKIYTAEIFRENPPQNTNISHDEPSSLQKNIYLRTKNLPQMFMSVSEKNVISIILNTMIYIKHV